MTRSVASSSRVRDGGSLRANTWQIYRRIAFPLVRPAAFVLGLFGFVTAWNDFLWPFIVLKSPDRYTIQIAIKGMQNQRTITSASPCRINEVSRAGDRAPVQFGLHALQLTNPVRRATALHDRSSGPQARSTYRAKR
jgi:hypothetical protein